MNDLEWDKGFADEQAGGDSELLAELLDLLCSSSMSDLGKIKAAILANDGEAVADAAHSIKGAAASLGVEGLRQLAYEFEQKGRKGELDSLNLAALEQLIVKIGELKI